MHGAMRAEIQLMMNRMRRNSRVYHRGMNTVGSDFKLWYGNRGVTVGRFDVLTTVGMWWVMLRENGSG